MDSKPNAGAIGVKMVDGKGKFLPESKRSLPTLQSPFIKFLDFQACFLNQSVLEPII
ncbi:MAG: hypothetical protein CM15mP107_3140 [Bacteroidota bacterium]|nr:MAG: hypothetical protein CM15mP107_3140 [Bacteroidota bacterium]